MIKDEWDQAENDRQFAQESRPIKDELIPCPTCHLPPKFSIEGKAPDTLIYIQCKEHGHMACGRSALVAVINWSHYVNGLSALSKGA